MPASSFIASYGSVVVSQDTFEEPDRLVRGVRIIEHDVSSQPRGRNKRRELLARRSDREDVRPSSLYLQRTAR
jgi:hypothetical protein